jgi:hypothetical protein
LLIRDLIAMLDGICAGIDRGLYADLVRGVDSNLEVIAVRFFGNCFEFSNGEVLIRSDLDDIDVLERVPPYRLPRLVLPVDQQEFLLEDSVSKSWIQIFDVRTSGDEFASRSQNSWTRNTACVNRVAQFGVPINPQ